ncbi:MAG: MFS transporter [Proteobacteria bacterium]|nr:MFS transporter [Pseudomonadota bacterium]
MPYDKSLDEKGPAFLLLKEKKFLLFFLAVFLSNVGNWLQNLALSWLSLSLKNTPSSFGFITFLGSIPNLFFSFIGGYIADNLNKRKTLICCQIVALSSALVIGIGVVFNFITYLRLAFLTFITGITTAISYPVYYVLMTEIVEIKNLPRAISIHSLQFNLSRMVGPLIFGLLVSFIGIEGCFLLNAMSFLPFMIILMRQKERMLSKKKDQENLKENVLAGFRYIRGDKILFLSIMIIFIFSILVLPYLGIMPYVVKNFLEDNPKALSYIMSSIGVGSISGAIIISFISRDIKKVFSRFVISGFLFSIILAIFSLSKSLPFYIITTFFLGMLMVFFYASANSFLQMWSKEEYRGRVLGVFTTVYLGVYPVGTIAIGMLGEYINLKTILLFNSLISLSLLLLICLAGRLKDFSKS